MLHRGETRGSGTLDLGLASAYPYARYRFGAGTEVWGIAGLGSGEADVEREHTGTKESSEVAMRMGTAGLRHEVGEFSGMQVAVRGDGGIVNLEAGTHSGVLRDISATASRVRLGLEGSVSRPVGKSATLTPFGEVAGRWDGGEQVSGTGLEFAGGLRLEGGERLSVEAQGRVLAMHTTSEYGEKGFSVRAELRPREDERGLSLSLSPRWGAMAQGVETLWRDDPRMFGGDGAFGFEEGGEVRGLVAWGMAAPFAPGTVTPFTEVTTRTFGRSLRVGLRYSLAEERARSLQAELAAERTDTIEGLPDYRGSLFLTFISGAGLR